MENQIEIREVRKAEDFLAGKELILEYVKWLGIDLSFQNFDKEMETLQATYSDPDGGLFIALRNGKAVGVAGIKRFNHRECEVKRMFVQPDSRGFGIGRRLLTECIEIAKKLNYETIKLDTADFMKSAISLYTAAGFVEIPAYRHNPHQEARYFELRLRKVSTQAH
ncbi:MAG: GNAT family N-acetyltransferase [Bacteroidota bacterium]|nr:GNAT family N-acetyltransferase [Bacteroidota bacterium]MDP4213348.1 GNAT family N-acetyltransferase [Bacteroidota bacterium]MDP4251481.1 GNAT family N-acetyltransferase [Bacteroidota bacterium]